jgi:hypothetical protein
LSGATDEFNKIRRELLHARKRIVVDKVCLLGARGLLLWWGATKHKLYKKKARVPGHRIQDYRMPNHWLHAADGNSEGQEKNERTTLKT